METDRRHETALAMELVMEPGLAQREPCISRPCDARLKYRRERSARDAPWRSERAFAASAVRRAVPLLMASAPQPRTISPGTTVRVPVRFAARLTRAAAHHQVECQYRTAQDARKTSHRNPGYYSPWHRSQTIGGKPRRKPPTQPFAFNANANKSVIGRLVPPSSRGAIRAFLMPATVWCLPVSHLIVASRWAWVAGSAHPTKYVSD